MIPSGVHDGGPRTASPIDADRPRRSPREGIELPARGGHPGRGRAAGTDVKSRTGRRLRRAIGNAPMNPRPWNRIPAPLVALLTRMRRIDRALRGELGRAPTFEEIAAALGLSDSQKAMAIRTLRSLPMRPPVGSDPAGDEPILLMEVTDRPEAGVGGAE